MKKMIVFFTIALMLVMSLTHVSYAKEKVTLSGLAYDNIKTEMDSYVDEYKDGLVSVAASVFDESGIIYTGYYGYSDIENAIPAYNILLCFYKVLSTHARRFGKSHAAGMIDAYYSLGCDSTKLFEDTKIAKSSDFKKYMNKYNVIHLDISSFWHFYKDNIVEKIVEYIYKDLKKTFKDELDYQDNISYVLMEIYQKGRCYDNASRGKSPSEYKFISK